MIYTLPDVPDIPPDRLAVDRIIGCWLRADDVLDCGQLRAADCWYADTLAAFPSTWEPERVASVASALSPGTRWPLVLEHLDAACEAASRGRVPGGPFYRRSREKALAAFRDGPDAFHPTRAPKTLRFALNLLGHHDLVTVDRWAFRIAGIEAKGWPSYALAEASYHEAARLLGETPAAVQSRSWCAVRDFSVPLS